MTARRLWVATAIGVALVAWWVRREPATPSSRTSAPTAAVLRDLAAAGDGLTWRSSVGAGVEVTSLQTRPAMVRSDADDITVDGGAWQIAVRPSLVTEIVCERLFSKPDSVHLAVLFRGASAARVIDELLAVTYPRAREADFRALCRRHGLRTVGW